MFRFLGFLAFLFGMMMILAVYKDLLPFWTNDRDQKIYSLWKQDIEKLSMYKKIPRPFGDIKTIEYVPLNESTQKLLEKIKAPIHVEPNGKYYLRLRFDDWTEGDNYYLLILYTLIEIQTQSTIWEMDRTLVLSKTNSKVVKTPHTEIIKENK